MATHELATAAGCQALYKAKGRNLRREDFPSTPEGWQMWCDHRIRKHESEIATATRNRDYWKSVRGGEHLQTAADLTAELTKQLAEVERLKKEIAEAQQTKK